MEISQFEKLKTDQLRKIWGGLIEGDGGPMPGGGDSWYEPLEQEQLRKIRGGIGPTSPPPEDDKDSFSVIEGDVLPPPDDPDLYCSPS